MRKRILIALALAIAGHLSSTASAQDAVACQYFDTTAGFQCGFGGRTASATNWLSFGGVNFAFSGTNAVAVGSSAFATGNSATVVGSNTNAPGTQTTAVGFGSDSIGDNSTALGANSSAIASNTTAVGANAQVTNAAPNAVALGAGSVANVANTVSIGSVGNERRIVNVAGPVNATDAANRGYVDAAAATATSDAVAAAQNLANNAQTNAQNFASNLVLGGTTAANLSAVNVNGGGITNAGRISGVAAGIAGNDAVNVAQLNTAASNAQLAADNAQTGAQNFATNLVTGGNTAASLSSVNVNGGGITNAGTISGVATATAGDQAVNFGQLQAVFTQLVQSGLCRVEGASVSCGVINASNALAVGANSSVGAGASNAVAVGSGASAQSAGGVAMGFGATAVLANSVAIGSGARARPSAASGLESSSRDERSRRAERKRGRRCIAGRDRTPPKWPKARSRAAFRKPAAHGCAPTALSHHQGLLPSPD